MKNHSRLSLPRFPLYLLLFTLFVTLTFGGFYFLNTDKRFERLTHTIYKETMLSNTLNMHYSVADPKVFGISFYEPTLPIYQGAAAFDPLPEKKLLDRINALDTAKLSPQNARAALLLSKSLTLSLDLNEYPYFAEPLSPVSGMQTQLPILLSEYAFRTRRDVEDYLALLDQTDEYFSSLLLFEEEKAKKQLLMSLPSLQKTKRQCESLITLASLEENSHFLQETFRQRLSSLSRDIPLSEEETAQYIARNNQLLKTVLLPAYHDLKEGLKCLEDKAPQTSRGLGATQGGKEYYSLLLKKETGSYRTPQEIKDLLATRLAEEYRTLLSLTASCKDCQTLFSQKDYEHLPHKDQAAMLRDLQKQIKQDFPPLAAGKKSTVTIKPVAGSLQDYSAPAYYLTTPVDNTDKNVIYINPKYRPSDLELYTTLAHEGFPGHLYQTVYCNRYFLANKENKIRQLLWYGGYLEGWALYVEFLSYDYAINEKRAAGFPQEGLCIEIEKHNRSLQLCLYSLLDLMIHYENADWDRINQLLGTFGIKDTERQQAICSYIVDSPCNYPKYYLGYLEILDLKEKAKSLWQENYSDLSFHSYLLQSGPCDFTTLKDFLPNNPPTWD